MNTFIQQGCIQFIKSGTEDIYNVENDLSNKFFFFFYLCVLHAAFWIICKGLIVHDGSPARRALQ